MSNSGTVPWSPAGSLPHILQEGLETSSGSGPCAVFPSTLCYCSALQDNEMAESVRQHEPTNVGDMEKSGQIGDLNRGLGTLYSVLYCVIPDLHSAGISVQSVCKEELKCQLKT